MELLKRLHNQTEELKSQGLYKQERIIRSPQNASIFVTTSESTILNFCANNYLGLANHPELLKSAHEALDQYGYGMASVRFICGTGSVHTALENKISAFLNTESSILYSSCFDANTGLFETILGPEDAIISDALNHASIIDGIRLCKAQRHVYANNNMQELEEKLKATTQCRARLIATDGVFSMDGIIADLPSICNLAEKYNALVMVDDSHAIGVIGPKGRGSVHYHNVSDKVHITTGTLGKALGGASGGFTTGRREIIDWLRQRSRPYLFSNTLCPVIAHTSIKAIDLLETSEHLLSTLRSNTRHFRKRMLDEGFEIVSGEHPIVPVMFGDAQLAARMAEKMLEFGIYVVSFSFPVVPMGKARIRVQLSAAHSEDQIEKVVSAFAHAKNVL